MKINLSAATAKKQAGGVISGAKKKVVIGEILGFVNFSPLSQNSFECHGQGMLWYRLMPVSVYGEKDEYLLNTSCLDLAHGERGLRAIPAELNELEMQAPKMMRVEILRHPHNLSDEDDKGEGEIEDGDEGGNELSAGIFKTKNVKDVSKKRGIKVSAGDPVDIAVTVLSGTKKLALHRPNYPSKKYSVRLKVLRIVNATKPSHLFTREEDSVSKVVCYNKKFNNDVKDIEKNAVVHYFKSISVTSADDDEVPLLVEVMDGSRVVLSKTFQVKVRVSSFVCIFVGRITPNSLPFDMLGHGWFSKSIYH